MYYFLHIFYLLTLVSSCLFRKIDFSLEVRALVKGLTDESKDLSDRRSFKYATALDKVAEDSSSHGKDESSNSDSTDEKTTRTTRKHHRTHKQTRKTTAFTTKYERGTTRKHKRHSLREHRTHHHKKKHHSSKTKPENRNDDIPGLVINANIGRELGDYVYTYVNSTLNAKGEKVLKVIIYNQTHYLQYKGNVIPSDYVHLYKLWTQLQGAKEFDSEFKPPWWMEWHKPPWWMDWHKPPAKLSNDSWDLWNEPGMLPPPPWMQQEEKKFNLVSLLREVLSKIKINDVQITSWKKVGANPFANMERDTTPHGLSSPTKSTVDNYIPFDIMKRLGQLWRWVRHDYSLGSRSFQNVDKRSQKHHVKTSDTLYQTGPHKIKNDKDIKTFTKQILNSTLNMFDNVRSRSNEYYWKKDMKHLARLYEEKYKEFLRDTKHQKIKSELGTQKVILNAIDVSDRIVWRLLNLKTAEMDKSGLLHYGQTSNIFQKEIKNEKNRQLKRACSELGICRSGPGIIQLILDVMHAIMELNDQKFKQAIDSLTEALKNTDFKHLIGEKGDVALKSAVNNFESAGTLFQRAVMTIFENIIQRRNTPLVVPPDVDPSSSKTRATLAFQEILNKIDEKVPNSPANIAAWDSIRNDVKSFAHAGTPNVQGVMQRFVSIVKTALENLDMNTMRIIMQNVNKIIG